MNGAQRTSEWTIEIVYIGDIVAGRLGRNDLRDGIAAGHIAVTTSYAAIFIHTVLFMLSRVAERDSSLLFVQMQNAGSR